jgi:hypothetical protein
MAFKMNYKKSSFPFKSEGGSALKDNGDVKFKGKHDQRVKGSRRPFGTTHDEDDDTSNAPIWSGAQRDDRKDSKSRDNAPQIPEHLKSTGVMTE